MMELRIEEVSARVAQFAETINNYPSIPASVLAANAYELLDRGLYRDAVAGFSECLQKRSDDQDVHFGMALARLGGVRPHRHSRESTERIVSHLRSAPGLAHAVLLELLVLEDHGLYWRRVRSKAVPPHVRKLAARVSTEQASRILRHAPAPEARTWQALATARRPRGATAS